MNEQDSLDQLSIRIRKIMRVLHAHGRKALIELGLTLPHYYALSILEKSEQHKMSDLKKELAITGAYATGLADYLIKKGFAKRGRWDGDRRIVNIVITDKGKNILKAINKKRRKFLSELLTKIEPKDRQIVVRAIEILSLAVLETEDKQ